MTDAPTGDRAARTARKRSWRPEGSREVADVLRQLMLRPWFVAGSDDGSIAKVRLHAEELRDILARLGWVLVVEPDFVRLRKSPPARRHAYATSGPTPRACQWFFLVVAAAESMGRRVALGSLVAAARGAAAEAGIAVTGDIGERRAIIGAIKALGARGVLEELDGDVDGYLTQDDPPVLLAVHHTRLVHVIANYSPDHDPAVDPEGWLDAVEREPDVARRMRRRLVDDTVVHVCDLDDAEADWLSRRLRDDAGPLAEAFGLHLERRSEGAAFVVSALDANPPRNLGPLPFPASGTVAHATLLVCNWVAAEGTDEPARPGWRRVGDLDLVAKLVELADTQQSGTGGLTFARVAPAGWAVPDDAPVTVPPRVLADCSWPAGQSRTLFVTENPSVLSAALDVDGVHVACTTGTPSAVEVAALCRLARAGWCLHVRADFDDAGLHHVNAILTRAPHAVPWRMSTADYVDALDRADAPVRLRATRLPATPWDPPLRATMGSRGVAVYEEAILDLLVDDLRADTR